MLRGPCTVRRQYSRRETRFNCPQRQNPNTQCTSCGIAPVLIITGKDLLNCPRFHKFSGWVMQNREGSSPRSRALQRVGRRSVDGKGKRGAELLSYDGAELLYRMGASLPLMPAIDEWWSCVRVLWGIAHQRMRDLWGSENDRMMPGQGSNLTLSYTIVRPRAPPYRIRSLV